MKIKKWKKQGFLGLLLGFAVFAAAGCGGDSQKDSPEDTVEDVVYPVSIDGSEIRIGETTVQTLLDKGLKITVSEMSPDNQITEYEIDAESELEANSYYSGASVWVTDHSFAHISLVTNETSAKVADAVIAYMEFNFSYQEEAETLEKFAFNGVPVTELTREKAGELFPDFKGDENMWFSPATMRNYEYFMAFNSDGNLTKFSVKKEYDVDWNNEG